jgi:hypothetical protein
MKVESESWPPQHPNTAKLLRAYSGSIFDIREMYDVVFPIFSKTDPYKWEQGKGKMYKIKYSCNFLT